MATKLIIVYPIPDSRKIPPMGRYRHSLKYDAHIWDGRDYDTTDETAMAEFNSTVLPALQLFRDRLPTCIIRAVYEAPQVLRIPVEETQEVAVATAFKRRGRPRKMLALV